MNAPDLKTQYVFYFILLYVFVHKIMFVTRSKILISCFTINVILLRFSYEDIDTLKSEYYKMLSKVKETLSEVSDSRKTDVSKE